MTQTITYNDAPNQLVALIGQKNKKIDEIFKRINESTEILLSDSNLQSKYDAVVSIEYLLLKARLECEFESLQVKQFLSDNNTPPNLKPIFLKRSQYLSEITVKLNSIREDITTLQKTVYTQQSRNFK